MFPPHFSLPSIYLPCPETNPNNETAKDKERRKLMAERTGGKHGGNIE
jgi:hypothetical protein